MTRILLLIALLFGASHAVAQSYPEYNSTTVNDYAGLLDDAAEARVVQELENLRKDTGVEMTVLTLSRQDMFAPDITIEKFATGLFNEWGIGDKTSNDGVLVLILKTDRAMQIELGDGYGHEWDRETARVIDRSFLPAFGEDRYQDGIQAGVTDIINSIVKPFLTGEEAPKSSGEGSNFIWVIFTAIFGGIAALIFKDKFVKLKKCPECGGRHLNRSRHVKNKATKQAAGDGDMITECDNCSYRAVVPYTISRISSSSSKSSFGGGSSSGGGAGGKW
ncbi:TPM domain-containing protein [Planktotalea sp.]|uniref:TPM domain-containing protein n=1 Tax=Planktotalea sp. TaxID=2029877 RepID=UPI003297DA25